MAVRRPVHRRTAGGAHLKWSAFDDTQNERRKMIPVLRSPSRDRADGWHVAVIHHAAHAVGEEIFSEASEKCAGAVHLPVGTPGLRAQPSAELSWDVVAGEKLVGAGFSGDNQLLAFAAATETAGRVRVTNLAGQNMTVLDLDARPIGLYRALGNAVFQLSTSSKGTIYMLDADSPEARLVAVPGQEVVNE